jgi:urease accessory protein
MSKRIALLLCLVSPMASAHVGHHGGGGFLDGLLHPLLGLDHLLAIVAMGMWIGLALRHSRLLGGTFLAAMASGALLGMADFALPYAEVGAAASVVAGGLLITCLLRLPVVASVALAAAFALIHGNLHGLEWSREVSAGAYLLGMLTTTATLIALAALGTSRFEPQRSRWFRVAGIGFVLSGAVLWLG